MLYKFLFMAIALGFGAIPAQADLFGFLNGDPPKLGETVVVTCHSANYLGNIKKIERGLAKINFRGGLTPENQACENVKMDQLKHVRGVTTYNQYKLGDEATTDFDGQRRVVVVGLTDDGHAEIKFLNSSAQKKWGTKLIRTSDLFRTGATRGYFVKDGEVQLMNLVDNDSPRAGNGTVSANSDAGAQ